VLIVVVSKALGYAALYRDEDYYGEAGGGRPSEGELDAGAREPGEGKERRDA
jgi:hypothetical protein